MQRQRCGRGQEVVQPNDVSDFKATLCTANRCNVEKWGTVNEGGAGFEIFTVCESTDLFMKINHLRLVVCIKAGRGLWDSQTDRRNGA